MPRSASEAPGDRDQLALLARVGALATILASVYLLLSQHPVGSGRLPDWVGHLVLFALLGLSIGLTVATAGPSAGRQRALAIGLIAVVLYGPLSEAAQYFVGRDAEWSDVAVDLTSSIPAFAIGYALPGWSRRRASDR